jgi:hypothetical protein
MLYRGPGLVAVVCFCSTPTSFPPLLSVSLTGDRQTEKERKLADGRGGKRAGVEPNHATTEESLALFVNDIYLQGLS